jgi:hypothetical protein
MTTLHPAAPEHAPDHPVKDEPPSGAAWRSTRVPAANVAEQVLPQSMPAGVDRTEPAPCVVTRSVKVRPSGGGGATANAAMTLVSARMVTVQAPCPLHAPLQPEKTEPAAAAWSSTTVAPAGKLA